MPTPSNDTPAAPAPAQAQSDELTLTEFCTRLSRTDRRVELIGGFHAVTSRAGVIKDTEAGFAARFEAFATQPA